MQIPPHLLSEHYGDRYFDVVNAMDEARHVFCEGSNIRGLLAAKGPDGGMLRVGETGFGSGRLLIALMDYLKGLGVTNTSVIYSTVELNPVTSERMTELLSGFRPEYGRPIDQLVDAYSRLETSRPGWHRMHLPQPFGDVTVNLWIGEALEMVLALDEPCDVWFLDGHGPKKNPSIWRPELLRAIGDKTVKMGTCATFTVAGEVRRGLAAAGFSVEQWEGFGRKKAVLRGMRH